MGKKEKYFDVCEELYVVQGQSLAEIARTDDDYPSDRTLGDWRDAGEWDKKRGEFLKENADIKTILSEIKKKLASELLDKLKKGEIDTQGLHVLNNLLRATAGKQYEDQPPSGQEKEQKSGITRETAERLREIITNG